jgi:hypothetical protein
MHWGDIYFYDENEKNNNIVMAIDLKNNKNDSENVLSPQIQ